MLGRCGFALQNTFIFHNAVPQNPYHPCDIPACSHKNRVTFSGSAVWGPNRMILRETDLPDMCLEGVLKALTVRNFLY